MIQPFVRFRAKTTSRRGVAVLLAFWLNLALIPCALAFETADTGHDCCPPTVELEAPECCTLDDVRANPRVQIDLSDDVFFAASAPSAQPTLLYAAIGEWPQLPPDPGHSTPPLYVLNCVFLK